MTAARDLDMATSGSVRVGAETSSTQHTDMASVPGVVTSIGDRHLECGISNQDAFACSDDRRIWAIADGHGPDLGGALAAQTVVKTLVSYMGGLLAESKSEMNTSCPRAGASTVERHDDRANCAAIPENASRRPEQVETATSSACTRDDEHHGSIALERTPGDASSSMCNDSDKCNSLRNRQAIEVTHVRDAFRAAADAVDAIDEASMTAGATATLVVILDPCARTSGTECEYPNSSTSSGRRLLVGNVGDSSAILVRQKPRHARRPRASGSLSEVPHPQTVAHDGSRCSTATQNDNGHDSKTDTEGPSFAQPDHNDSDLSAYDISTRSLTTAHRPTNEEERIRIEAAGGIVDGEYVVDAPLPTKMISVTRCMGDKDVRSLGIISKPSCQEILLDENDAYVVLATDGLWDAYGGDMSEQTVAQVVCQHGHERGADHLLKLAAGSLPQPLDDCTIAIFPVRAQ